MNFILRKDKITFWKSYWEESYPANICLFQVNNRNTRKRCEICSKLTIKILERRHCYYIPPPHFTNILLWYSIYYDPFIMIHSIIMAQNVDPSHLLFNPPPIWNLREPTLNCKQSKLFKCFNITVSYSFLFTRKFREYLFPGKLWLGSQYSPVRYVHFLVIMI